MGWNKGTEMREKEEKQGNNQKLQTILLESWMKIKKK